MRRRSLLVLMAASAWVLIAAPSASALTCPAPSDADVTRAFASATAVVVGQVEQIEPLAPKPPPGSLNGRFAAYSIRVLEVHKGRRLVTADDTLRVIGLDYGWFGDPPAAPTTPIALLLDHGDHGWATGAFSQCGIGVSVAQARAYGAANPEPRDRYVPLPPEPPVCFCFVDPPPFVVSFGPVPKTVRGALARGLPYRVRCTDRCSFVLRLSLSKDAAKRFGLARRRVTVASVKLRLTARQVKRGRVRFTPRAKRALGRAKRLELGMTMVVRSGARRSTRAATLTLAKRT